MPRPWTVLSHAPLEKLQANLWSVESALPKSPIRRRMGYVIQEGGLFPHLTEIEASGTPAFAMAGNGFHRLDLAAYRVRYPQLKILAPPATVKRVSKITHVDGWLDLLPQDSAVRIEALAGTYEGVCVCTAGGQATLAFPGDLLANQNPLPGIGGLLARFFGFVGDLRVPRLMKWIGLKDKRALREHLLRLADTPGLQRIFTCHGPVISVDPNGALRRAALAI